MTDQELLQGIIDRDKTAVQYLVRRFHKQVIKTAYYFVHDMKDAEDLAQDVCIEILESARNFRGNASLNTWIYRITVNKSLNFIRKNKRTMGFSRIDTDSGRHNGSEQGLPAEPVFHDTKVEDDERRHLLEQSILSLPENQRTAFVLHKYDELPYKEIAEIMNTSLSSVESLIHRAKLGLQKRLMSQFSEYTPKHKHHGLQGIQK
jgi:RNA polymerase sigma-70 factor (ECF subfamily)